MIKQSRIGLDSRSKANALTNNGMLPLIASPMYSVIDSENYELFLDNNINVCLPRGIKANKPQTGLWQSYSLQEFEDKFCNRPQPFKNTVYKVLIDVANGNMPRLHAAIKKAKNIYNDNLRIMAGNVSSVEAFVELTIAGADYIRIGIGGSINACNTTSNTGVGQKRLDKLIRKCYTTKNIISNSNLYGQLKYLQKTYKKFGYITDENCLKFKTVKLVADGISSFIKDCVVKYNYHDNGYAAINKLLYSGADYVMIGSLFANCLESASEKYMPTDKTVLGYTKCDKNISIEKALQNNVYGIYNGMSTLVEQEKYKTDALKPSEGKITKMKVRWTLDQWLNGVPNQDNYPYLSGYVNSLKSAMSYVGSSNIEEFKIELK